MRFKTIDGQLWGEVELDGIGEFETLKEIKDTIQRIDAEVQTGTLKDVYIDRRYYDYSDSSYICFVGYRRCTPEEEKKHEESQLKEKKKRDEMEKAQYEQLKKKFG
jgi:hypothetical protein